MPKAKLLRELLQEQQEPFSLDAYLLERGYLKCTISNAASSFHNSAKILKNSAIFGLNRRLHVAPKCSDLLKLAFNQIVEVKNKKRIKNLGNYDLGETRKSRRDENEEDDELTVTTVSSSCSESDAEDIHCPESGTRCRFMKSCDCPPENESKRLKRREVEDNKQLSPVSVLEETESDDGSPVHYKQCDSEKSSSTSTSQRKRRRKICIGEVQQLESSDSYSQYMINKRVLRQSRKLLIDCTREVIENHEKKDKLSQILGADELWRVICENVWRWSKDSIQETNTILMLHSDFRACAEEWSDFPEQQKREISIEIGDAILDEIINEIVTS